MAQALRLAEKGLYTTQPNPRVGCVLVCDGVQVAAGYHLKDGQGHAEAIALAELEHHLTNPEVNTEAPITAYVTLEPCSFQGRTPSCAHALVKAGVDRVVYAMTDPHPDNPSLDIAQFVSSPLFNVLSHGDVLRLPVVGFHVAIELIRPLVFERQQVERHRLAAVDNPLGRVRLLRLGLIQNKPPVANLKSLLHLTF